MAEVEQTEYQCPECGSPLAIRPGSRGRFFACTGYPNCRWTANVGDDGSPQPRPRPQPLEENCPDCGKQLMVREGRRGKFVGCTGYPNCRYTRDYTDGPTDGGAPPAPRAAGAPMGPAPKLDEACPDCGRPLAVRNGRRGPFVGCTGYPGCRYTRDYDPAKEASGSD